MIEKELIVSVKTSEGGKCDTKDSYSKITRKKDNYEVETRLECGKEKNTITRKFSFNDCKNCTTDTKNNNTKNNDTKIIMPMVIIVLTIVIKVLELPITNM